MTGYRTPNSDPISRADVMFGASYGVQSCTPRAAPVFISRQSLFRNGLSKVDFPEADVGPEKDDPDQQDYPTQSGFPRTVLR